MSKVIFSSTSNDQLRINYNYGRINFNAFAEADDSIVVI
nr:MAG TPA: hypothetical protein [Caudoviricetes sp.]